MKQKALLHSWLFLVFVVCVSLLLANSVRAQTPDIKTAELNTKDNKETKASLGAQEKAAEQSYAQALKACEQKIAPAQCRRQAGLDYKQNKQALRVKRESLDLQSRREKADKHAQDKANSVATGKQGQSADGQPLARAPLSKQSPKNKANPAPLSKPQAPSGTAAKPKERLSKQSKPPKGVHGSGTLSQQPTPDQRKGNVAKFAKLEPTVAARKAKAAQKKAKRQAKDDARRAAGYPVDKP